MAGPSRGIPNADQLCGALAFLPPGCLVSLAFLGSEGQGSLTPLSCRAEGGLKKGDGLFLLVLPGGRPDQSSTKPLTHFVESTSVIQDEDSCPSYPQDKWEHVGPSRGR